MCFSLSLKNNASPLFLKTTDDNHHRNEPEGDGVFTLSSTFIKSGIVSIFKTISIELRKEIGHLALQFSLIHHQQNNGFIFYPSLIIYMQFDPTYSDAFFLFELW